MRETIVLEVLSREGWWVEKRRKEYRRPRDRFTYAHYGYYRREEQPHESE